ncbi:MAG: hypothetical protein ACREQY_12660 [Candidatus Binatia bacterium]
MAAQGRERGERFPIGLRLAIVVLVLGVLVSVGRDRAASRERTSQYSSHAALNLAHELEQAALELPYDDPRLVATYGFLAPDETLVSGAERGYVLRWRIEDDVPARDMKRIEIRVSWPMRDGEGLLSTLVVKAS